MPTPAPQPPGKSARGLWPHTMDWLADHPRARQIVREVWDTLDEEDRAGRDTTALRQLLLEHQPTLFFFRGRCLGCRRRIGCYPTHFPCIVWHQARVNLGLLSGWPQLPLRIPRPGR
ncbi:MAG: hypothetical protein JO272_10040 [Pseudonocardiales bacterium]|nr:hypothetical protein [Pseudonocardiales bacterium]